ncbi:MAG: aspartyl/asparaginyl beta-hydroxylase domain-containing protein [Burkholderiales bacterium]
MSLPPLKYLLILFFLLPILYVHFRGHSRLKFVRQLTDHSALLAPYNVLVYLFSNAPDKPLFETKDFPELHSLRDNWQIIRDEAISLSSEGHIRTATGHNDAGFNSFFKEGWRRFYLTWYGESIPSAETLCPKTVALLKATPGVKSAMFALLPPGGKLNPHRDPFAGSLRYHLGLVTPNSPDCNIHVDGEKYFWRDGEDIMFDETYVHWAENKTDVTRIILFADIERPLKTGAMRVLNRFIARQLGKATVTQNFEGEKVGALNKFFALFHQLDEWRKQLKQYSKPAYILTKILLVILLLYALLA